MAKSFETTVEIKGSIGSSFINAFRQANSGLGDLRKEAKAVQQEMDRLGRDFREGKIYQSQYTEETQKLTRELGKLEKAQQRKKSLANDISAVKTNIGNVWGNTKAFATTGAVTATAVASAAFAKSINTAADFEAQMSRVGAIAGANTTQMDQLSASAIKLGASTSKSATEVAQGMENMAAMGFSANEILGAMPGVISAAEASGADMAQTADVVSSSLNIFGLKASEATRVADILAQTANQSAANITDMQYALKYAGPPADSLGMSLEETSAAIGIMTNAGMEGEQAGTTLRAALLGLLDPSEENSKMMSKMGIQITDSKKNFVGLSKLIENLSKSMEGQTDTQKAATLSTLVGKEAVSGMISLMKAGPSTIDKMTKSLENSAGASAEVSKKMKDNFAGAKDQIFGAFESAQIAFATPILPVLQDTFNGVSATIEGNMGSIEKAGKAVANVLEDITAPFNVPSEKPIKPKIEPTMNPDTAEQIMANYQEELKKYELFSDMDMSDKVEYMLNEVTDTMDTWLKGEGGEVIDSVFTELGTLAGKAWLKSFTTAATGAVENLAEGNFSGALGMGIMANMMTGGLLVSGGLAGGKWALGKGKELVGKGVANVTTNKPPKTLVGPLQSARNATSARAATVATAATKSTGVMSGVSKLGNVGKVAGKAFLPLNIIGEGYSIYKSNDKTKAASESVGGLAASFGGAKLGAAIGTAIAPGIGTAIGGLLGGAAGYIGGKWIAGKAVDTIRGSSNTAVANSNNAASQNVSSQAIDTTQLNASKSAIAASFNQLNTNTNSAAFNMQGLVSYVGQASGMVYGSFNSLKINTDSVAQNMATLTMYVGQASGWIVSGLYGIQSAGQRVTAALNNLEKRINAVNPSGTSKKGRLSYE